MMQGWQWHDPSDAPLADKLAAAIERYTARQGAKPNVCYVHPGDLGDGLPENGVVVRPLWGLQRGTLMLCREGA